MAVAETWETLKHAVETYTGLSPSTFFTVLALVAAFYYAVSGFFEPQQPPMRERERDEQEAAKPLPPPVQLGEITDEELCAYDGSDSEKPLLMAIKGQIYDVTQSRMFYGPGGPYALFAGKDASRALAKMSFETKDLTGDISGLGPFELEALQDWEYKFMSKYVKVGTIKKTVPVTDGSVASGSFDSTEQTTQATEDTSRPAYHKTEVDATNGFTAAVNNGTAVKEDVVAGHGDEAEEVETKETVSAESVEEIHRNA